MKTLYFDEDNQSAFSQLHELEWLETNGLGGWASTTISGAHTRRYHGLLVAALHPPLGRMVVLSKLDEAIIKDEQHYALGTNQYPGTIYPQGYQYLRSFQRDLFPVFEYQAGGVHLKKTVAAIHGENTTVVLYEVLQAAGPFTLELLPLYACRDFHSISRANEAINKAYTFAEGIFHTQNYADSPPLYVKIPGAQFKEQPHWYYHVEYAREAYRGLDFQEDLYTHGTFQITLEKGSRLGVILSTEHPGEKEAVRLLEKERTRRENLVKEFSWNENIRALTLAADQFVVRRGKDLKTLIAGYHWFSDWGRDTMIALPGICLVTGRFDDARKILNAFAAHVSEGMLPNWFPDRGEQPEYNTVDATLWFFQAIYQYYQYTGDLSLIRRLLPVLKEIIAWHQKGTRFQIHVDNDGLLYAGQEGVQLTWMDAKVGDWVVTPRTGKAVEINALWYNAIRITATLLKETGHDEESDIYHQKAIWIKARFLQLFWNAEQQYLYDYVAGEEKNQQIRPNAVYALSLPFPLLEETNAELVLQRITKDLLTPRGLRSLAADDPQYIAVYGGSPRERDGAYHQGTVWSFLLGPYLEALIKVKGEEGKAEAMPVLHQFLEHLQEGCIGTVSEIFDAAPPHAARGCVAQAWGVGEVLRVALAYQLIPQEREVELLAENQR